MKVASVLAAKGGTVVTIGPDETVQEALGLFATHKIGALVRDEPGHRPLSS